MNEYIEKQALRDKLYEADAITLKGVKIINQFPPADVRPVVRGRWVPFTSEAAGDIWYCSACDIGFAHHMDFCPHCGADMRGTQDE